MDSVQEVARSVLGAIATDAGHVLVARWVAERYTELVSKVRYRHLRQIGEVIVPATVTAGTVTVTQNSPVVVPDATALAAWTALPMTALVGRSIRVQEQEWYLIEQVVGTTLVLQVPYVSATVAGAGYQIAARQVALDPTARWLSQTGMIHMRTATPLGNISLDLLNIRAPQRNRCSSPPQVWAEVDRLPDGTKRIEFYPYPSVNEVIHYVFWSVPPDLGFDTLLPKEIDGYVLKEGALVDAMRYEASKAARAGQADVAAYWRNEYRMQETVWRDKMRDAARTDRGVDDVSFILQGFRGNGWGWAYGDIATAHQQVWSQWSL